MKQNRYSIYKILKFQEKIESFKKGEITPPIMVYINPTNKCNHRCWFCVYNYKNSGVHQNTLFSDEIPFERMDSLVDELSEIGVRAITFSGGGEPLFYKNIDKIFDKINNKKIDIGLITNAQLLSEKNAEVLSCAKWIRVSASYYNKESFIKSRRVLGDFFDKIVLNIKNFVKCNPSVDIGMNYVITEDNYNFLKEAAFFWKETNIKSIRFSPVWFSDFEGYHRSFKEKVLNDIDDIKKLYSDNSFEIQDSYKIDLKSQFINECRCLFLQTVTVIASDSNVYSCHNMSYEPNGKIGSIKNQSFKNMWESDKTREIMFNYDPRILCKGRQCANKTKVEFYNTLVETSWDNFV